MTRLSKETPEAPHLETTPTFYYESLKSSGPGRAENS